MPLSKGETLPSLFPYNIEEHPAAKLSCLREVHEALRSLIPPHQCSSPQAITLWPCAPLTHTHWGAVTSHAFPSHLSCLLLMAAPAMGTIALCAINGDQPSPETLP